ncbi:AraC family transcriptional regulator [Aliiruegeria lutimaris]|uniref:Transcriptional regulator, AraC family n=1 Tax=Aliiruegeria lutimaris TaxID=571298 RepID=A0A1G8UKK7_9RHOB|nr:AraC family transcriptional regulator [Aliiruegeria lutimaris]SDJ54164.1 transcriptional regulator, AraC family [Aliiruegeria lutimaris]
MKKELIQAAQDLIAPASADGVTALGVGEALLLRRSHPSAIEGSLYRPLVCLILQGAKDVQAGALSVHCPAGHAIIVSHDLPVLSRITEASPNAPYIAFVLPIDLGILRGFYDQTPDFADGNEPAGAIVSNPADPELICAVHRFLAMIRDDHAAPLLGPILLREIHARLLLSPHGAILRRFLRRDDPSNHLARAIGSIRGSIDQPLSVAALAERAGMSKSSFHVHFKAVTGLTPGQYQKDIRLLEARRLIVESDQAVSSVAFDVGYESPAQFSRDYARKFGRPPREDRKIERLALEASAAVGT